MRAFALLPLLLAACGGATIVPPTPDATPDAPALPDAADSPDAAALPDVPSTPDAPPSDVARPDVTSPDAAADVAPDRPTDDAPTPSGGCAGGAITRDRVSAAQVARVAGGLVAAWYPYGAGNVVVQGLSEALEPQGAPLSLSLLTNGVEGLSLSFEGRAGVLGAGSSLYLLAVDDRLQVTLTRRADYPRRLVRYARMASPTVAQGVIADGTYVSVHAMFENAYSPNDTLTPPHGPEASFAPIEGGYVSVEPIATAGGTRILQRRFIFGHGFAIANGSAAADGQSGSPTALAGDTLVRLVFTEGRDVDARFERRSLADFSLRAEPTVLQPGAAWHTLQGAIDASSAEPFVAWAGHLPTGGFNSAVQAMWVNERAPRTAFHHVRDVPVRVFGVASDAAATRGWVVFGVDPTGGSYTLFGRCVDRGR